MLVVKNEIVVQYETSEVPNRKSLTENYKNILDGNYLGPLRFFSQDEINSVDNVRKLPHKILERFPNGFIDSESISGNISPVEHIHYLDFTVSTKKNVTTISNVIYNGRFYKNDKHVLEYTIPYKIFKRAILLNILNAAEYINFFIKSPSKSNLHDEKLKELTTKRYGKTHTIDDCMKTYLSDLRILSGYPPYIPSNIHEPLCDFYSQIITDISRGNLKLDELFIQGGFFLSVFRGWDQPILRDLSSQLRNSNEPISLILHRKLDLMIEILRVENERRLEIEPWMYEVLIN